MKRSIAAALLVVMAGLAPVFAVSQGTPAAVDFQPPATRKAVRNAFWDTIYGLERKQTALASRGGGKNLVERIRDNLRNLPPRQRTDAMLRFLRIAHHYRGKESSANTQRVRDLHAAKFFDEVAAYSLKAKNEFLKTRDDTYVLLFTDIRALAAAGSEGLKLSRDLARIDPQNALIQGNLAQDYLNVGDLEGSVAASRRAISLDPTSSLPFTTMASAKYSLGDPRGAHEAASSALLIDPGDKVAYSIMKLTQAHVEAPEAQSEAAGMDGAPVLAFDFAGREPAAKDALQSLGAGAAAVRLSPAGVLPPNTPSRLLEAKELADQARLEIGKGDYLSAIALTGKALAKDPRNTAALFRRAHAKYRLKKFTSALADTTAAVDIMGDKPNPILLMLHARILNSLDRPEEALAATDRALGSGPQADIQAKLLFQKAWALGGLGRKDDALHSLAQAARLDEEYIPYYQEALELPANADWSALFSGELLAEAAPYPRKKKAASGGQRLIMILVMTLLGGFLVALGLLRVVAGRSAAAAAAAVVDIAPPHSDLIGGAYQVKRKIGVGGMGIVYEAFDVNLRRPVAIKKMREDICFNEHERERFLSEARTVAALRHPNIVEIHAVVSDESDIYLVFELVEGHTVADYIHHYKKLEFGQALRILHGTATGLEFAHLNGVIHRDLKPSNIMINRDSVVKVMDFGVARQAKDSIGMHSQTITGTPPYMAPEQEEGNACTGSDVFALAVCSYELVTGALPFYGTGGGMSLAKRAKSYVPAARITPGLPAGYDQVLAWGLEPDPVKRCQSPAKFVRSLEGLNS